jgi:hypothetical protein
MQVSISIMLTFAVFKLRLNDDVPVQSDYIPLISLYFTLCMCMSMCAMIWFSIKQILTESSQLPNVVRVFVTFFLFWIINKALLDEMTTDNNTDHCNMNRAKIKGINEFQKNSNNNSKTSTKVVHRSKRNANATAIANENENELKILIETSTHSVITRNNDRSSLRSCRSIDDGVILPTCHQESTSSKLCVDSVRIPITAIKIPQQHNSIIKSENQTSQVPSSQASSALFRKPLVQFSHKFDLAILSALNKFVFFLFLTFMFVLNFLSLFVFPRYLKSPLQISENYNTQ